MDKTTVNAKGESADNAKQSELVVNKDAGSNQKAIALREISDQFGVVDTVRTLQGMMTEVTKKEINPDTVNAACNCVQNLNLTIRTAIQAAKYLSEK